MRALPAMTLLALLSAALAGCSGGASDEASASPALVDALDAWHAGAVSANIERLGQWGETSAEVDACGQWLFVDAGATVQILDVSDPTNPVEVADVTGLPDIQDVKSSDDCAWLFVGNDDELSQAPLGGVARSGGLYVVDVADKAAPRLASYLPVGPRRGPHMVTYHQMPDGRELVFGANADVSINLFDRASGTLRELSRFQPDVVTAYNREPQVFDAYYQGWTHDMQAALDPATGKTLLYTASWDAGLRIVDITDPSSPVELGGWNDFPEGHEGNLHTVATEWVGGRSITVGAVEVGFALVGGVSYATHSDRSIVYVWDTTDPTQPTLLGSWENPDGKPADRAEVEGTEGSTHNLQLEDGRIYLAHYNLGVFVLDVSTPEHQAGPALLAYHHEPDDTVWDVVLSDGILYSSGSQGVIALHYAPDLRGADGIDSHA